MALHGGGMAASEGSLERVYSPWTKVRIHSFIHSHKCIRKAPENENNAHVTEEIVHIFAYLQNLFRAQKFQNGDPVISIENLEFRTGNMI